MDFLKKLKLIERIDGMISRKSTGSPGELSQKIGVSERTLYNIIATMKILGAPIYYSSAKMSYCYSGAVSFSYVFNLEDEKSEEIEEPEDNAASTEATVKNLHDRNITLTRAQSYGSPLQFNNDKNY